MLNLSNGAALTVPEDVLTCLICQEEYNLHFFLNFMYRSLLMSQKYLINLYAISGMIWMSTFQRQTLSLSCFNNEPKIFTYLLLIFIIQMLDFCHHTICIVCLKVYSSQSCRFQVFNVMQLFYLLFSRNATEEE